MRVLCIGDIVGDVGISFVEGCLPAFRKYNGIDFVIANGENASNGNGLKPSDYKRLLACGVDVVTGGNHSFDRSETHPCLNEKSTLLRPANFDADVHGIGHNVFETEQGKILVVSLIGTIFMAPNNCPFKTIDKIFEEHPDVKIRIIDFHAEATSEKRVMGFYVDGRASVVYGTHTHVQTADEQIQEGGCAFISDVGMCGVMDSVIGADKHIVIERITKHLPTRLKEAVGKVKLSGIVVDIDNESGKCLFIERIGLE